MKVDPFFQFSSFLILYPLNFISRSINKLKKIKKILNFELIFLT
jgi:hypothetical protein